MTQYAAVGRLVLLLLRNEHIHAAGRAMVRGAARELVKHLQTRYRLR